MRTINWRSSRGANYTLLISIMGRNCCFPRGAFRRSGAVTPAGPATSATAAGASAPAASVIVPGGTPVKVCSPSRSPRNSARAGAKIHFKAVEDVTVDGWVVVSHDAIGEGSVVSAESAGGNGDPGKIQFQFDWIYGSDGLKIKLSDVATTPTATLRRARPRRRRSPRTSCSARSGCSHTTGCTARTSS